MSGHSEQELRACFDALDTDGSGEISRRELVNALTKLFKGDEEKAKAIAHNILKQADSDLDGKITWQEFKSALA